MARMAEPHSPLAPRLVLGSTSVYRRDLLQRLRLPFTVSAPNVDEQPLPGESPEALAGRLALEKAHEVASRHPDAVVIGSDQTVDLHGRTLGKPGHRDAAVAQLLALQGQRVVFHSAVAVVHRPSGFARMLIAPSTVLFRPLTLRQIETYLRLEQPYDCAGSAKCETLGITLLAAIESDDPTALIGLPLIHTCTLLAQAGLDVLENAA